MARYSLTPEHREQLAPWAERWIANAMSTAPADRERMVAAMDDLYRVAGLEPPPRHAFVRSPMTAAIAGSVAAGIWWLREHPDQHVRLFGRPCTERDLADAIAPACALLVTRGMAALRGDPVARADATDAATRDADAIETATRDATRAATTRAATTRAATHAAVGVAVDAATRDAIADATDAATFAATDDATFVAIDAAAIDSTAIATDDAIRAATRIAVADATGDATSDDATFVAIDAAVDASTRDATDDVRAATDDATRAAAAQGLVGFLVECARHWWRMHDGGSDWSGYAAYLSFFRHVAKLPIDWSRWAPYEEAAEAAASRIVHARFWIAADRHTEVHVDDRRRLHSETGPARAWGDGWAVWAWHGVRVPRRVIEEPWSITVADIDAEPNAEVRRVMVERFGMERFIRESGARVVGRDDWGTLWARDMPDDDPLVVVEVVNSTPEPDGTAKRYMLRVPPEFASPESRIRVSFAADGEGDVRSVPRTPRAAIAWTFGLTDREYAPVVMS